MNNINRIHYTLHGLMMYDIKRQTYLAMRIGLSLLFIVSNEYHNITV